jgi:hypothetical protein
MSGKRIRDLPVTVEKLLRQILRDALNMCRRNRE